MVPICESEGAAGEKEVEKQLQFLQRELKFLQQLQGQQREREEERERGELKAVLMNKDAEVRQLQDQLREVERELGCAREEARNLREEFQRVKVELAEKSAHVCTGAGKGQLGWRSAWIGRIRRWRCYWFRVLLAPKRLFKRKLRCLYINFAG